MTYGSIFTATCSCCFLFVAHKSGRLTMNVSTNKKVPTTAGTVDSSRILSVTVIACLIMAFACLTLALVILVVMTDTEGTAPRNDTSYCCPDVASQLIAAANFTLDPCGAYTKYVCHNMEALSRKKVDNQSLEALHISATIGLFRSPAGKYIAAFHRSCLFTLGSDLPEKAMTALVETTGVSKTMSPMDVLRVLIQLSVLHGLHTPVNIIVDQLYEGTNVFNMTPDVRSTFAGGRYDYVRQKVLTAYNEILRVNVSKEDLSKLHSSSPKTKLGIMTCNDSFQILHTLVSGVSQQEWIAMAAPFHIGPTPSVMCYSDIDFIGEILHALTSESERREVQLALLLVMCSVDLVLRRYAHQPNPKSLFSRCEGWTNQLTPLWRIIAHEQLTDSQRDRDVRGIFIATKKAVTGEVLEFLHPVDASDAVRLLSTVRLVLPKQLIPDDLPLPEAEPNYYLNALTMKLYRLTVDKRLEAFV
ncbi:unnamed protein product, partial [Ixodes persulcatus]